MMDFWRSIAARKEKLDARDEVLREQEDEARQIKKTNRPSSELAQIRQKLRHTKTEPKRWREPKIYGRRRERLAIDIERLILERLEARKNRIARSGCIAVIEDVRTCCFVSKETSRDKSKASEQAEIVAMRQIVDEICDRLLAEFCEKPIYHARNQDWSETELRALWRQRMALLNASLEGADRNVAARELYDQDRGSLALYERIYYSDHLASQQSFERFVRVLRDDAVKIPAHTRPDAYRRGWNNALGAVMAQTYIASSPP